MKISTATRFTIYAGTAGVCAISDKVAVIAADKRPVDSLTAFEWAAIFLPAIGAALVAVRAFIDQSLSRNASK